MVSGYSTLLALAAAGIVAEGDLFERQRNYKIYGPTLKMKKEREKILKRRKLNKQNRRKK